MFLDANCSQQNQPCISFRCYNSEHFYTTAMSAVDTVVTDSGKREHEVATVKQFEATTSVKFSIRRLSLRRTSSQQSRKGSLESAGLETTFFMHQTPLLEGHVFKDGRGTMTGFTKRYFLLFEGVLIYYSHQSSYERDQKNNLRNGTVYRLDNLYLSKVESPPHGAKHCFNLHVPHEANNRKTLLLATSNRKSKNIWMEMLQKQNPRLQPSHQETQGFKKVPSYIFKIREYHLGEPQDHSDSSEEECEQQRDVFNRSPSLPLHRV